MYCRVKKCVYNMNGCCDRSQYIMIEADGTCDSIREVEIVNETEEVEEDD